MAPGVEVGEITTHGLALSRLKHGFESRWGHHLRVRRPRLTQVGAVAILSLAVRRPRHRWGVREILAPQATIADTYRRQGDGIDHPKESGGLI